MSRAASVLAAVAALVVAAAAPAGAAVGAVAWRDGGFETLASLAPGPPEALGPRPPSRVLCSLQDPRILESSGLVDAGRLLFTTNDSGDGPYLYGVSKSTCRTVVTTTYSTDRPTDVEALAPGRRGSVWVGDIGDNTQRRSTIAVYHVPEAGRPRQVAAPEYTLRYPDGPHNAEALLADPRNGRLYVVTKSFPAGTVYAAPSHLSRARTNLLRRVATVPMLVTDGSFLPDGEHVILRSYADAALFTFPGFRELGTVRLPRERQGEGLAVSSRGRLYLSSEGRYARVLEVALPGSLAHRAGQPGAATLGPTPTGPPAAAPRPQPAGDEIDALFWIALGVLAAVATGWGLFTFALPRSRRKR